MRIRIVIRTAILAVASVMLGMGMASADDYPVLYMSGLPTSQGAWLLFDADWNRITLDPNTWYDGVVVHEYSDNNAWNIVPKLHSWTIDYTNNVSVGTWCDGAGTVTIGEGGLTMTSGKTLDFGDGSSRVRVKLAESQTWQGPATGTRPRFCIGTTRYTGSYYHSQIAAERDLAWTLQGLIGVYLFGNNDLSGVDVVVKDQAALCLSKTSRTYTTDVRLHAKSLTLDGATIQIGKAFSESGSTLGTTATPDFTDDVLAPTVVLLNGGSVDGGTVNYGVSRLSVTGGDSTFSGAVTFVGDEASVDVASGASLTFSGSLAQADGVSSTLNVTGGGCVTLPSASAVGVVSGADASTLAFAGAGVVEAAIEGFAKIEVSPDAGALATATLKGDLSGFAGTEIRAKSGTVFIHPKANLPAGVNLVADAGATIKVLEDSDLGTFTVDGKDYERDADGIAHARLYMEDYSGNTYVVYRKFYQAAGAVPEAEKIAWQAGAEMVYENGRSHGYGMNLQGNLVNGIEFQSAVGYQEGGATIGKGGLRATAAGIRANFYSGDQSLKLAASQVWSGPAASALSSVPFIVGLGGDGWNYFYNGSLTPLKPGLELTLRGDLWVRDYYMTNDLSTCDVRIEAPAFVSLQKAGNAPTSTDYGRIRARKVTFAGGAGMSFGITSKIIADAYAGSPTELTSDRVAKTLVLENGGVLHAAEPTVWSDVRLEATGTAVNTVVGTFVLQDEVTEVGIAEGATLDLRGATLLPADGVEATLAVTGPGTVVLDMQDLADVGISDFGGAAIELHGHGALDAANVGALTLVGDGVVTLPQGLASASAVKVTSGTLLLDSVAALPVGVKVETEGSGNLMLRDWTGFDKDTMMSGTKCTVKAGDVLVTDDPIEGTAVALGSGQTLWVCGDGLKASSTLTLGNGASVVFLRTTTVSAPVTQDGSVTVSASDPSVTGTLAGTWTSSAGTSQAPTSCNVATAGTVVFSGDMTFAANNTLDIRGEVMYRGEANRKPTLTAGALVRFYSGRLTFVNSTFAISGQHPGLGLYQEDQEGDVAAVFGPGSSVTFGNNQNPIIGRSDTYESRFVIDGGTVSTGTYDPIALNGYETGRGVFEFKAGEFKTNRRIFIGWNLSGTVYHKGTAKVIWSGGTWIGQGNAYRYFFPELIAGKPSNTEFVIAGTNCVLNLENFTKYSVVSNFNQVLNGTVMRAEPGSKLKIVANNQDSDVFCGKVVLSAFEGDGLTLETVASEKHGGVEVEIPNATGPVELGWTLPGTGSSVKATGTSPALVANYVVPAGQTFATDRDYSGAFVGFSSVTTDDLVFEPGSTLDFPIVNGVPTLLTVPGSVFLPETMTYVARQSGTRAELTGAPVLKATGGIVGDCTWTSGGGISKRDSSLVADGDQLLLDYHPTGTVLTVR